MFLIQCKSLDLGLKADAFEGEIVFDVQVLSLNGKKLDLDFVGNELRYVFKDGMHHSISNGKPVFSEVYDGRDTVYGLQDGLIFERRSTKVDNSESILNHSLSVNQDTILGYVCDRITIRRASSVNEYYFNKALRIPDGSYEGCYHNDLELTTRLSQSIALKTTEERGDLKFVLTAREIKRREINSKLFEVE